MNALTEQQRKTVGEAMIVIGLIVAINALIFWAAEAFGTGIPTWGLVAVLGFDLLLAGGLMASDGEDE